MPCSPAYAAPELLRGVVSEQADIYAVGHLIIECLTGRTAYGDLDAISAMVANLGSDEVPIPQSVLDGPFGTAVKGALHKDPAERWRSAADLLEEMELGWAYANDLCVEMRRPVL